MYFDSWDEGKNEVRTRVKMKVGDERRKNVYRVGRDLDVGMSQQELDDLGAFPSARPIQGILEERKEGQTGEPKRKRPDKTKWKEGKVC